MLDQLAWDGILQEPVAAMGESYGAVMALRWHAVEPRIVSVVAITPYAGLSNTILNLRAEYASWLPKWLIRAGLKKLPATLGVPASELDTTTELARQPQTALFIAAGTDNIAPVLDVEQLHALASPQSRLLLVPDATHETVTYCFSDLAVPVLDWLRAAWNWTGGHCRAATVSACDSRHLGHGLHIGRHGDRRPHASLGAGILAARELPPRELPPRNSALLPLGLVLKDPPVIVAQPQFGCRVFIEKHRDLGMLLEDARGVYRGDGALHRAGDRPVQAAWEKRP